MLVPERWQDLIEVLLAPIAWIPRLQEALVGFFLSAASPWTLAARYAFLLLPALLAVGATWITMVSLYTLPFRAGRLRFVSMMLLAWWDAARAVWLYWVGVLRLVTVAVGWAVSVAALLTRLAVESVRRLAAAPFAVSGRVAQSYFSPGVPWIAFVMLMAWCVLEATVFTYTMTPTVAGVLSDLSGEQASPLLRGVLFTFLLMLVMGSFAGLQGLADAARTRQAKFLAQIVVVEVVVMFFEVMFLYRELVDAVAPWIIRDTGLRIGFWATMTMASLGWLGTRALTWFLFGQYGTAPLLAFIARRPLVTPEALATARALAPLPSAPWWRASAEDFRRELEWVHGKGEQVLEYLALPVLQLVAAGLNFAMMIVASRPVFPLPFRTLKEATETRDLLATFQLAPRKQPSV
ncbi:MAG TPA: hypothetical protein VFL90_02425 [Methylomirabilota bacterium]|nr:hypothetical protein [Methylomirabilota bacterium]